MSPKSRSRSSTQLPGSGRGKGKVATTVALSGSQPNVAPFNRSKRAGIQFPVARIHRLLKIAYEKRVTMVSAVYLAAVLEYLIAEVLELGGNACRDVRKSRITPRHLQLAIRNDLELNLLLKNVVIVEGGVVPHIAPELLKKSRAKESKDYSQEV
ncbi:histone-fold-containing protein [Marasmius fiardii PR-910]|nr:histone-fold-containing protein [Marasmius fiardii PR-910]